MRVIAESSFFFQDSTSKSIPIMLCGNKTDLRESHAEEGKTIISAERGEKLAKVNYILHNHTRRILSYLVIVLLEVN